MNYIYFFSLIAQDFFLFHHIIALTFYVQLVGFHIS